MREKRKGKKEKQMKLIQKQRKSNAKKKKERNETLCVDKGQLENTLAKRCEKRRLKS